MSFRAAPQVVSSKLSIGCSTVAFLFWSGFVFPSVTSEKKYRAAARRDGGSVDFGTLPVFMELKITVEAENQLGKVQSEALMLGPEDIGTLLSTSRHFIIICTHAANHACPVLQWKPTPRWMWMWCLRRDFPPLCWCVGNTPFRRTTSPSSTTSAIALLRPTCGQR